MTTALRYLAVGQFMIAFDHIWRVLLGHDMPVDARILSALTIAVLALVAVKLMGERILGD